MPPGIPQDCRKGDNQLMPFWVVYGYFSGDRFASTDTPAEVTDEIALNPAHFTSRPVGQSRRPTSSAAISTNPDRPRESTASFAARYRHPT